MIRLEDAKINGFEKIEKLANLKPVYCIELDSILTVTKKMLSANHRRIPILSKSEKMVGIVTYMDILDALLRGQKKDSEISNIMTRDVISCEIDNTISFVLQKLKMSRRGGLPVLERGKLKGMITERDIVKCFLNVEFGIPVKEVMTPKPFYISKKFSVLNILKSMVNTRYRRLPVMENGILTGIVTAVDVLRYVDENDYNLNTLDKPPDPIIKTDVYTISDEEDVSEAIKIMNGKDVGGILVVNEKLEGIITERDILEQII